MRKVLAAPTTGANMVLNAVTDFRERTTPCAPVVFEAPHDVPEFIQQTAIPTDNRNGGARTIVTGFSRAVPAFRRNRARHRCLHVKSHAAW